MMNATRVLFLTILVTAFFLFAHDAMGQAGNMQVPDASQAGPQREKPEDAFTVEQKRQIAKKQNEDRQKDIKKDTDKLLELATELKQYVDKTNENVLSMDVVKKAEQIEKLAKSVREKMKGQ